MCKINYVEDVCVWVNMCAWYWVRTCECMLSGIEANEKIALSCSYRAHTLVITRWVCDMLCWLCGCCWLIIILVRQLVIFIYTCIAFGKCVCLRTFDICFFSRAHWVCVIRVVCVGVCEVYDCAPQTEQSHHTKHLTLCEEIYVSDMDMDVCATNTWKTEKLY